MKALFLFIIGFFLLHNCAAPTKSDNAGSISGTVYHSDGTPFEGAVIVINYNLDFNSLGKISLAKVIAAPPSTTIEYRLAESGPVKLWITKYNSNDIIIFLVNDSTGAGSHRVAWDGTNSEGKQILSGLYQYHIEINGKVTSKEMLFLRDYHSVNNIDQLEYHAKTDQNGYYEIQQEDLDYVHGYESVLVDGNGNELGHYKINRHINIWALYNNFAFSYIDSIFIAPDRNVEINFIMNE